MGNSIKLYGLVNVGASDSIGVRDLNTVGIKANLAFTSSGDNHHLAFLHSSDDGGLGLLHFWNNVHQRGGTINLGINMGGSSQFYGLVNVGASDSIGVSDLNTVGIKANLAFTSSGKYYYVSLH